MQSENAGRKVLIIDCNNDYTESMAKLLRLHGHQVAIARTGPQGLAVALEIMPRAILLDIALPGLNGLSVATQLRASDGFDDVMMIAITGYGDESHRVRSVAAGIDHHLLKPIRVERILSLLGE